MKLENLLQNFGTVRTSDSKNRISIANNFENDEKLRKRVAIKVQCIKFCEVVPGSYADQNGSLGFAHPT